VTSQRGVVARLVTRHDGTSAEDQLAVEEPLEIRVATDPVATTMRTPGEDAKLAVGFLFAEGIVRSRADVGTVAHCGRPGDEGYGNVIEVTAAAGARLPLERAEAARRGTLTTAACGVCGRRTIDDLLLLCPVQTIRPTISADLVRAAPGRLVQPNFARTGAVHAAAVLGGDGTVLAAHEDVGRHNAVDKVVGRMLMQDALPLGTHTLFVSGRTSFEIVQKAWCAGIPIVASVSAPSSLAIAMAEEAGLTLVGFVRDGHFNIYTHQERITG
jgi:FdhD protein